MLSWDAHALEDAVRGPVERPLRGTEASSQQPAQFAARSLSHVQEVLGNGPSGPSEAFKALQSQGSI